MSFIWPPMLLLALVIPVGVALYLVRDRRRRRRIAEFGAFAGAGTERSDAWSAASAAVSRRCCSSPG